MCGIAGAFGTLPARKDRIGRTLSLMARRGPDGTGMHAIRLSGGHIDFLHSRLAIVDLDARASQPFVKDGLSLIFNGEIYNHPELRTELEAAGHRFSSTSDTEVILEAYRAWGTGCVKRFEGMWAFAICDEAKGSLFLSRDRFGEKPLYWRVHEGTLYFGSEVKFLSALAGAKPSIDRTQLRRYLVNGYKALYPSGHTFFEGVHELPPGSIALLDEPGAPVAEKFWTLAYSPKPIGRQAALDEAARLVRKAVSLRLRADVPVAVRLSGGIDSNIIASIAWNEEHYPLTTFSIVEDDPRYDETANINLAVERLGCPSHRIGIPREGFLERLEALVGYFDAPVMTISYYLHSLVSEAIHEHGYKVALGGTGADEVFSGYYDHYLFWLAEMKDRPDFLELVQGWRDTYGKFVRNPYLQDPEAFIRNPSARDHIYLQREKFSDYLVEPFDEPHRESRLSDAILRNRMLNECLYETVPVMLHEDDLSGMYHSVENRAPYLDSALAEFLFTVPSEHLIQQALPKYLLRNAGRGKVPDEILWNPRKQGINAPVTSFVDFSDPRVRGRLLEDGPLFEIVNRTKFEELLSSPVTLNSESKFLFSLICAKLFLEAQDRFEV